MKTILRLLIPLALAVDTSPQTRVASDQIRPNAAAPVSSVWVIDAARGLRFASIGQGLTLTCSTDACSIEARPIARTVETVIVPAAGISSYTTTKAITGELDVLRNGIEMAEPGDYTVSGQVITFVASQRPAPGDVVKVKYR